MPSTSPRGVRRLVAAMAVLACTVAACSGTGSRVGTPRRPRAIAAAPIVAGSGAAVDPIPLTASTCLARPPTLINQIGGEVATPVRADAPLDSTTYDARSATFAGDGQVDPATGNAAIYPLLFGKAQPATGLCVIGGSVPGTLSRTMTWPQLKAEQPQSDGRKIYFDAAAVTEYARGDAPHLIDGLRVDDVADGVAARGSLPKGGTVPLDGGNFDVRNVYFTAVHDDCVDVNDLVSGVLYDSLLDGCYTGISERPDSGSPRLGQHAPAGQQFVLDHVLVHMTRFPGPHPTAQCPNGTPSGYNSIFKWSDGANEPVIRDTVFLLDEAPCSERYFPFPANSQLSGVTIVWNGQGRWRWPVPSGVTVTTRHAVWDRARAMWLTRHGCPDTGPNVAATTNPCTRMTDPTLGTPTAP